MAQILIIISFIIFNFPKSRIFLGDGGSYLFGGLIAMNAINTSKLNPEISPFFFCVILFYLFYEVFFSFCRKLFKKKSPVKSDSNHLHMLIFDKLQNLNIKNPNALTGLVINLAYLLLILPICFNFYSGDESALFSRYWFFTLLVIYTLFYAKLYKSKKK
jgi:UDP-N-acetylmuramyl pentapeptide phosphotransferase/UDP-N-acetylglucosamine-1-phosphate transferase